MRFLSVCSGIEAASVAWQPLGWQAAAFSEIEPFPCSLLAHHYPNVPNLGDMTKFKDWPDDLSVDLLCGGTPCQSFSLAGLRKGLADPRGNLMLTYGAIAAKYRPRWLVWENVPGVLSSNEGTDFGSFLGLLGQLGYGFAYRVLDAQYLGCALPRPRVYVVGCFGDWRSAAAVLFERSSLAGDRAASGEEQALITGPVLTATGGMALDDRTPCVLVDGRARRATPLEWERALGFPDDYTLIPHRGKPAADGPRYKALGNSWAVPCARWIGERIEAVEAITNKQLEAA